MKRKDFLRKMRSRRRGDQLELREPEQRRAIDWRTLRVDLPAEGETQQSLVIGTLNLTPKGIRLSATRACWVRGYRAWRTDAGEDKAEFQYRAVAEGSPPPPGTVALQEGEVWSPEP